MNNETIHPFTPCCIFSYFLLMKKLFLFCSIILLSHSAFSQNQREPSEIAQKGNFYVYWGWNWDWYQKSNITFKGTEYDFELQKVIARDRQSPFDARIYFNPLKITIPQYNFRLGYFINDHYNISLGIDHMKYVMVNDQRVKISGHINNSGTPYDGNYSDDDLVLADDFLRFEHTDGLNYPNLEFRRFDEIFDFNRVKINLTEGLGFGMLYPRTNTTLLNKERYDEFHVAGYGLAGVVGINLAMYKWFFIQSELKGGFINMPDIRTTSSVLDKASQHFFFSQLNVVFGATLNFSKHKNK